MLPCLSIAREQSESTTAGAKEKEIPATDG